MAFEQQTIDDVQVLKPLDRLDGTNAPELERAVQALLQEGCQRLVFDLSALSYISSAGLRVVLVAGKGLRAQQGQLALAAASGVVREVLEMSGFLKFFPLADDLPAAAAQLQPGA